MSKERNKKIESNILEYLGSHEKLLTRDAIELFGLSESTIRRIFTRLEEQKKVVRTYGGIIAAKPDNYYHYDIIKQKMKKEKEVIGSYAAGLIKDSDFIYIDCGTTTAYMAQSLVSRFQNRTLSSSLNIVTNSLINLEILNPYCNVILVGGTLFDERKSMAGTLGVSFLSQFHFSKSFLGADGMTFEHGFSSDNINTSRLSGTALTLSQESYVLLDSSKIEHPSYVNYAELDEATAIITDSNISENHMEQFKDYKIQLHISKNEIF